MREQYILSPYNRGGDAGIAVCHIAEYAKVGMGRLCVLKVATCAVWFMDPQTYQV